MKKISLFTGTRAEYGLLYWILKDLSERRDVDLQLFVGGMHMSTEFGKTVDKIIDDGFEITAKMEFLLSSDTPVGVTKSMGLALISAADLLDRTRPDLLIVLGDRFEALAICQAAMIAQVPIAHIHGGELTKGVCDEAIRHAITKMSHLHFTSTEDYRRRVIQLGEAPERVFNFGSPGIDSIEKLPLLSRTNLSSAINFDISKNPYVVVTYHPVTLSKDGGLLELRELTQVLSEFDDHKLIISYPNADTFGRSLIAHLENFRDKNKDRVILVKSLGQLLYLSLLKHCEFVIGNSSSGLIEAPSFKVPTINIGDRQADRVNGETVINCSGDETSIRKSIYLARSNDFKEKCKTTKNPYGIAGASQKIVNKIIETDLRNILFKRFYDLQ